MLRENFVKMAVKLLFLFGKLVILLKISEFTNFSRLKKNFFGMSYFDVSINKTELSFID